MNCPYCAEEIKDKAIACRWCGRDFILIKPLLDKINNLEQQIAETRLQVEQLTGSAQSSSVRRLIPSFLFSRRGIVILGLFAVTTFIFALFPEKSFDPLFGSWSSWFNNLLSFFLPVIFGVALGFNVIVDRPFVLLLITTSIVCISGIIEAQFDEELMQLVLSPVFFVALPVLGVGWGLLLLAGSVLGRWIGGKWFGITPSVEPAVAFARRYYTGKGLPSGEESKNIKKLAEAINAFTPILTFLATILGAYLTYLGTRR